MEELGTTICFSHMALKEAVSKAVDQNQMKGVLDQPEL